MIDKGSSFSGADEETLAYLLASIAPCLHGGSPHLSTTPPLKTSHLKGVQENISSLILLTGFEVPSSPRGIPPVLCRMVAAIKAEG